MIWTVAEEPVGTRGVLALRVAEAPRRRPGGGIGAGVQVWRGDTPVFTDQIAISKAEDRGRFAEEAARASRASAGQIAAALVRLEVMLAEWLAQQSGRSGAVAAPGGTRYAVHGGRICRMADGHPVPLCNFTAAIEEEATVDDGAEQRAELAIALTLDNGEALGTARIPRARFSGMDWPLAAFGTRAIVEPGQGARDHLRAAIQTLSTDVRRRQVYGHGGWRRIGGVWHYLHGGGAIGPDGPVAGVEVQLGERLAQVRLPDPPGGEALADAVRASLAVLEVAPDAVAAPLLGAVYRAPLCEVLAADSALWLEGQTGTLKSEISAIAQAHYGAGFTRIALPANWECTANMLELVAFQAKDILLVIDDYAPRAGTLDAARQQGTAERIIRAMGNQAGRGRMQADLTQRPSYYPRGVILTSGEDVLKGQSQAARLLVAEVAQGAVRGAGSVHGDVLARCQVDAAAGRYAGAMAGYVRWLAGRLDTLRSTLPERYRTLVAELRREGQHLRTPGAVAGLLVAWELWVVYAGEVGAISEADAAALLARVRAALLATGEAQAAYSAGRDPVAQFCGLLAGALAGGRAYCTTLDGGRPEPSAQWGWKRRERGVGTPGATSVVVDWEPTPGARHIGYAAASSTYLLPDAAYAMAQALAGEKREGLAVTEDTLWRRMRDREILASVRGEGRLKVRVSAGGARPYVIHIRNHALLDGKTGPTEPIGPQLVPSREDGYQNGALSWARFEQAAGKLAHNVAQS